MSLIAKPPDFLVGTGRNILRRQRRVLHAMPLAGELPVRFIERRCDVLLH